MKPFRISAKVFQPIIKPFRISNRRFKPNSTEDSIEGRHQPRGGRRIGSPRRHMTLVPSKAPCTTILNEPLEFKTRTYHGRVGSRRTAGQRRGTWQGGTPTEQFAQKRSVTRILQGIEDTSPERFPRSTNKRLCKTIEEPNERLTTD